MTRYSLVSSPNLGFVVQVILPGMFKSSFHLDQTRRWGLKSACLLFIAFAVITPLSGCSFFQSKQPEETGKENVDVPEKRDEKNTIIEKSEVPERKTLRVSKKLQEAGYETYSLAGLMHLILNAEYSNQAHLGTVSEVIEKRKANPSTVVFDFELTIQPENSTRIPFVEGIKPRRDKPKLFCEARYCRIAKNIGGFRFSGTRVAPDGSTPSGSLTYSRPDDKLLELYIALEPAPHLEYETVYDRSNLYAYRYDIDRALDYLVAQGFIPEELGGKSVGSSIMRTDSEVGEPILLAARDGMFLTLEVSKRGNRLFIVYSSFAPGEE